MQLQLRGAPTAGLLLQPMLQRLQLMRVLRTLLPHQLGRLLTGSRLRVQVTVEDAGYRAQGLEKGMQMQCCSGQG